MCDEDPFCCDAAWDAPCVVDVVILGCADCPGVGGEGGPEPDWDIALLQECPPRWCEPLARACGAEAQQALTSRNSLAPLRSLAAKLNPDLIASGEGGSNLTLVRSRTGGEGMGSGRAPAGTEPAWPGRILLRRELVLACRPERRVMAFTELSSGLCVANLHATNDRPAQTAQELRLAAETAARWAGTRPLIFGGDLNLRPAEDPALFDELRDRHGLRQPTGPRSIDHLLVRGLSISRPPEPWPASAREVPEAGLRLRLSDHAPVEAEYTRV